jgi:hypothetical protein
MLTCRPNWYTKKEPFKLVHIKRQWKGIELNPFQTGNRKKVRPIDQIAYKPMNFWKSGASLMRC